MSIYFPSEMPIATSNKQSRGRIKQSNAWCGCGCSVQYEMCHFLSVPLSPLQFVTKSYMSLRLFLPFFNSHFQYILHHMDHIDINQCRSFLNSDIPVCPPSAANGIPHYYTLLFSFHLSFFNLLSAFKNNH